MEQTIFPEYVNRVWPKLNLYINEKTNNSQKPLTYLHKQMLTPVYSPDQKWEGTSANTRYVAADMVSMDSPLPVKKRSTISKTNGTLPKIGMKKQLRESDINSINIMKAQMSMIGDNELKKQKLQQILARFVNDGYACSVGIDERNEYNFLKGISEGVVLIESDEDDDKNTGTGMRVNYGYKAENSFGVADIDDFSGDDIDRVMEKADKDGNTPTVIMLSKTAFNRIRKSRWARELVADYKEMTYTDATKLPVPSSKNFKEAVEDEKNLTFLVVDRSVSFEKNGVETSEKPFNPNKLVFLPSADNVGSLVWGTLAEATNRVKNVSYSVVDQHKLISRYAVTDPAFSEFSKGQSLSLPVIENVDAIYTIDLSEAQSVNTTEEAKDTTDVKITIWGVTYKKPEFVAEYNKIANANLAKTVSDSKLVNAVNKLSDADEAALKKAVESHKATATE